MLTVGELRDALEGLPSNWPVEVALEVVWASGDEEAVLAVLDAESVAPHEAVPGIGHLAIAARLELLDT